MWSRKHTKLVSVPSAYIEGQIIKTAHTKHSWERWTLESSHTIQFLSLKMVKLKIKRRRKKRGGEEKKQLCVSRSSSLTSAKLHSVCACEDSSGMSRCALDSVSTFAVAAGQTLRCWMRPYDNLVSSSLLCSREHHLQWLLRGQWSADSTKSASLLSMPQSRINGQLGPDWMASPNFLTKIRVPAHPMTVRSLSHDPWALEACPRVLSTVLKCRSHILGRFITSQLILLPSA